MMEVTYVMTPAEWGKPIDVAEQWIHFVDESVKDSEFGRWLIIQILLSDLRITTWYPDQKHPSTWSQLLDPNRQNRDTTAGRIISCVFPQSIPGRYWIGHGLWRIPLNVSDVEDAAELCTYTHWLWHL